MLVRLLAAVLFTLAGSICGISYSIRLRESCGRSDDICSVLRKIAVCIRYTGSDVYEITKQLKAENTGLAFIKNLPEHFTAGVNFHEEWHNALADEPLYDEEKQLLEELGSVIGTSDTEGQLAAISALEERAEQLQRVRSDEYCRKGKMYRSVGVLAGVMVGILVI
jgi:stage III sporulation protein AB